MPRDPVAEQSTSNSNVGEVSTRSQAPRSNRRATSTRILNFESFLENAWGRGKKLYKNWYNEHERMIDVRGTTSDAQLIRDLLDQAEAASSLSASMMHP